MAVFASDDFTGTDGALVEERSSSGGGNFSRHPISYQSGDAVLLNNRVVGNSAALHSFFHSITPPSPDYSVSIDVIAEEASPAGTNVVDLLARCSPTEATNYHFRWNISSGVYQLRRTVAGVIANIVSQVSAPALVQGETRTMTIEVIGTSVRALVNGVQVLAGTDTNVTDAGRPGFNQAGVGGVGTGIHLDNFSADNLGAGGGAVDIQPSTIESTAQVGQPTIQEAGQPTIITPSPIASTAQVGTPDIPGIPVYYIFGNVVISGTPVEGAIVWIIDPIDEILYKATTDVNGDYAVTDLIEGREYVVIPMHTIGITRYRALQDPFVLPDLVT